MAFTDTLYKAAHPIWDAQLEHPFVTGLGDGTLEPSRFRNWVEQDYVYLKEFARVFAWAAAKSRDLDSMGWYAAVLDLTLNTEMELHRQYARRFDVEPATLEAVEMWPTTRAYTDFLVRTSADGDMPALVAALLPCSWGYAYVGQHLADQDGPDDERYAEWIATYSSDEFVEAADWLRDEMDRLADTVAPGDRQRLVDLFVLSSRYEHAFWDMCWHGEGWSP